MTKSPVTQITSPGHARDQLDVGLDLIRTCENACYQDGGCSKDDVHAIASTIEQAVKLFIDPVREWLDDQNAATYAVLKGGAK